MESEEEKDLGGLAVEVQLAPGTVNVGVCVCVRARVCLSVWLCVWPCVFCGIL